MKPENVASLGKKLYLTRKYSEGEDKVKEQTYDVEKSMTASTDGGHSSVVYRHIPGNHRRKDRKSITFNQDGVESVSTEIELKHFPYETDKDIYAFLLQLLLDYVSNDAAFYSNQPSVLEFLIKKLLKK